MWYPLILFITQLAKLLLLFLKIDDMISEDYVYEL